MHQYWVEDLEVYWFQDKEHTSAQIEHHDEDCGTIVIRTGAAKRNPGDRFNQTIGATLALARAFEAAARRLNRRAQGLVRNAEWVQQEKARLRANNERALSRSSCSCGKTGSCCKKSKTDAASVKPTKPTKKSAVKKVKVSK